jgi:hypothetical protein
MQTLATFADWDIADPLTYTEETWYIEPGKDYPHLAWEGVPPVATVRLAVLSASEKFLTGRTVRVANPVVTCPMTDVVVEEGGVILLTIAGEFGPGDAIPVRVRAPGRVEVLRTIPYAGDGAESIVWLWDISQYAK